MGFYIKIQKIAESEQVVQYAFESDQKRGVLEMDKQTAKVSLIDPMPGDERQHCFTRATVKVSREWANGRLPQDLEWAS